MKSQSYMTRALRAKDLRFATVLGKLGYSVPCADPGAAQHDISELRAEYERVLGKKPFNGWDAEQLLDKIASANSNG